MKTILALTRYGSGAASTRQRFLQYEPALSAAGFALRCVPLFNDEQTWAINSGRRPRLSNVGLAYFGRAQALAGASGADLVWVHYELFPYLPGIFERGIFLSGVPVVIDYDDAFFHAYDQHDNALVRLLLGRKMKSLIAGATTVVAGNAYLANYARQWNEHVVIIPTVVDTNAYRPSTKRIRRPVTIGWMGSPHTWRAYVRPYLGLLRRVCEDTGARFLAVGTGDSSTSGSIPGMELRPWAEEREVADIQEMDIGIMPLPDDPWARGKCGYKLIQYMACGLPTLASPVGVNADITRDGETGLLADSDEQWLAALRSLIDDSALRQSMGRKGRERAVELYSLQAQAPRLVEVMQRAAARR